MDVQNIAKRCVKSARGIKLMKHLVLFTSQIRSFRQCIYKIEANFINLVFRGVIYSRTSTRHKLG